MAAPISPLLDNVNRADDSSPPPGASWAAISGYPSGLFVIGNALARGSNAAYRHGNYWNQTITPVRTNFCEVWVELSAVPTTYTASPGFQLYLVQGSPNLSSPSTAGNGFTSEIGWSTGGITTTLGPSNSAGSWGFVESGSWNTFLANDIIAISFDGVTARLTRYRAGVAAVLIEKPYDSHPDDIRDFAPPYNPAVIGTPFQIQLDMLGDQQIRITNFGAGVDHEYARPDGDISDGSWINQAATNTNLFSSLDENTVDAADYVESGLSPASTDTAEIRLSDITP